MATSPNQAQNAWTGLRLAPPRNSALAAGSEAGKLLKLAFGLLLLDTFLTASRILEIGSNLGVSLPYVGTAVHVLVLALAFVTGGVRRMVTSRTGMFLILYTGWMMVCTPFSSWRTGSLQTILYSWMPAVTVFFASGLLFSLQQCRKLGSVLALSGLTIAVTSNWIGTYKDQRLAFTSGTLGNANDVAMLLLLAAPFFLVPLFDPLSSKLIKLLGFAGGLLVIAVNFRTGSRAGLIALLAILASLFLTRTLMGKVKLAAAVVALGVVLVAFIPSYSLYRYATLFSDPETLEAAHSETYGSTEMRKELLRESAMVTLQHPFFGVGPGVYAPAMAREAERQGKYGQWAVSHNTYTQVSSEMGFPGLIFYLGALVCAYLDILWARKNSNKHPSTHALALGLLLSLVGLTVNSFFGSNAYMAWMPVLLGLAAALRLDLQRDLEQQPAVSVVAAPATPAPKIVPAAAAPAPKPVYTYRFLGRPPRVPRS